MKKLAVFILTASITSAASAELFVQAGAHFGGDTLVTAVYTDGTTEQLDAGGLISGSIGNEFDIAQDLLLRVSIGVKVDALLARNADVSFGRFPLDAMLMNESDSIRFGAGLTYHTLVDLDGDSGFGIADVDFDDALGFVLQVEVPLNERGYIGLKYTDIDYETSTGSWTVDGSSIGVVIGLRFEE